MSHWIIAPILVPLIAAGVLLGLHGMSMQAQRAISAVATGLVLLFSVALLMTAADGDMVVYQLGDWAPPFGIALVLDRLSALMLTLTALLAVCTLAYACRGDDAETIHFHTLFQFQLMGLALAFLTGDLFNLFVAFEILLIASYSLLVFGGGAERSRAGLHYVVLNLVGSAIFLLGVGILYGVLGTLNMADLARLLQRVDPNDAALIHAASLLLLVAFALKAAALPLLFWLPRAYAAASAPVAALFAIMTKVGIYAILRVNHLMFGGLADEAVAAPAWVWLWPVGIATIAFGAAGVLAAKQLRTQVAYLVIVSSGTLLAMIAHPTEAALAGALFYMVHTTLVCAALFLLARQIGLQRGPQDDRLEVVPARPSGVLALLFLLLAASFASVPPFTGFLSKVLMLRGTMDADFVAALWAVLLVATLATVVGLSRSGSLLFWYRGADDRGALRPAAPVDRLAALSIAGLVAVTILLAVWAEPLAGFATATASQLLDPAAYVDAVLSPPEGP